eukprot:6371070-Pyramimonas_sp.AAC.2
MKGRGMSRTIPFYFQLVCKVFLVSACSATGVSKTRDKPGSLLTIRSNGRAAVMDAYRGIFSDLSSSEVDADKRQPGCLVRWPFLSDLQACDVTGRGVGCVAYVCCVCSNGGGDDEAAQREGEGERNEGERARKL